MTTTNASSANGVVRFGAVPEPGIDMYRLYDGVHNRANSYTATLRPNYILKSWLNSGFEIIHRRETK